MNVLIAVKKFLGFIVVLAPIKTVFFNLRYLPFKDAVKFPVFVYRHTRLLQPNGKLVITAPLHTGMIKLGHYVRGTQDERYLRTTWEIYGEIIFGGDACIGRGTSISVGKNAKLVFGENLTISGNTEIYCHHLITIGNNCTFSWGILMMDTDFHAIKDIQTGEIINGSQPVSIGSHVWIGSRVTILKGVRLASNMIVAAASLVTKSFDEEYCVIAGQGKDASVIKRNVLWEN